jgi:c-di-GMP-binding flagellar brake protein YcgR
MPSASISASQNPDIGLKALLLCSDEKIVRVLRRTLGDLDIAVELCPNAEMALRKLTRQRYEAIIVDCAGEGAAEVLRSSRSAPCNKQAVAVAIVEPVVGLRVAFAIGAHFVLYKPVSVERAKSSFRAAKALMKSERRRNTRVAVQMPLLMRNLTGGLNMKATTIDLSEGGVAITLPDGRHPTGRWQIVMTLPGTDSTVEIPGEMAWGGSSAQAGVRFQQMSPEAERKLREWIKQNSADIEQDDPPIRCQLTDLSLGACYLELSSPFPPSSRVSLSMRAGEVELRVHGVVRVMHPDKGMGVEFTQKTAEHRSALENFLQTLNENRSLRPELLVEAEGLENDPAGASKRPPDAEDPLLNLFYRDTMSAEEFQDALREQRNLSVNTNGSALAAHA